MTHQLICDTCGNEIPGSPTICPFCEQPVTAKLPTAPKKKVVVREIVIKEGQPTVEEALDRFKDALRSARKNDVKVLRVIHGYGSSGEGGAIKLAFLDLCSKLKSNSAIKTYKTGVEYYESGARHNSFLKKYPELKKSWKHDRGNAGVTLVEL